MLTTQQEKQIAAYMNRPYLMWGDQGERNSFSPELNSDDCLDLFDALIDECKKRNLMIRIHGDIFEIGEDIRIIGFQGTSFGEFNAESVGLAYLKLMESK